MFLKTRFDLSYFVKCYDYTETETILIFHGPIVSLSERPLHLHKGILTKATGLNKMRTRLRFINEKGFTELSLLANMFYTAC